MTTSPTPETTIVIRAFNEERWLPEVFQALDRQYYRDFEVLLVDSGSIDRTRDIATAHPDTSIGSYPFLDDDGKPNTNIVVRSRDADKLAAAMAEVQAMLAAVKAARP